MNRTDDTPPDDLDELRRKLADRDRRVRELTTDLEIAESKLRIREVEIAELTLVTVRNRERVKAEMAAAVRESHPRPPRE